MYVSMYVCMHAYMHVHAHVHLCACEDVCIRMTYVCVQQFCVGRCMYTYAFMHTRVQEVGNRPVGRCTCIHFAVVGESGFGV